MQVDQRQRTILGCWEDCGGSEDFTSLRLYHLAHHQWASHLAPHMILTLLTSCTSLAPAPNRFNVIQCDPFDPAPHHATSSQLTTPEGPLTLLSLTSQRAPLLAQPIVTSNNSPNTTSLDNTTTSAHSAQPH